MWQWRLGTVAEQGADGSGACRATTAVSARSPAAAVDVDGALGRASVVRRRWEAVGALARAAAANGNAPGSARYVYVTSKLEAKGAVAGELRSGASDVRMFNAIADVARFDTFRRYATAKQAGTALTFELARRAESAPRFAGIAVHCVSPGMVNTNLGRFAGAAFALAATVPPP